MKALLAKLLLSLAAITSLVALAPYKVGAIPSDLQLKAIPADVLGKIPVGTSTVVKYGYKARTVASFDATKQAFLQSRTKGVTVTGENVGKRTPFMRVFDTSSSTVKVAEIIGGQPQYYKDPSDQTWYEVDYATTTEAAFNQQIGMVKRASLFADVFVKKAFACVSPCTFYPDPNVEVSSVDGYAGRTPSSSETFATIIAGAGNESDDSLTFIGGRLTADTTSNKYIELTRSIIVFDTSGIGAGASISSATVSFYGYIKNDALSLSWGVYGATPASNTALANSDYGNVGSTAYSNTTITTASWSTSAYNDYALNATGLAAINSSGVTGFSRRTTADATASAPTWSSGADCYAYGYSADQAGTSQDPKLVVTFTAGASASTPTPIPLTQSIWLD